MTDLRKEIQRLKKLATSEDWHLRERAGFTLRNLLEEHFEETFLLSTDWVEDADPRVRRACCLGCMQRKKYGTSKRIQKILGRLKKIMPDGDAYVKKCCGPFVVGYLGYTYPKITLPWLEKQTSQRCENVRWNIAKAFSQALGRRFPEEALHILALLAQKEQKKVDLAIRSSLVNILRAEPKRKKVLAQHFSRFKQDVLTRLKPKSLKS